MFSHWRSHHILQLLPHHRNYRPWPIQKRLLSRHPVKNLYEIFWKSIHLSRTSQGAPLISAKLGGHRINSSATVSRIPSLRYTIHCWTILSSNSLPSSMDPRSCDSRRSLEKIQSMKMIHQTIQTPHRCSTVSCQAMLGRCIEKETPTTKQNFQ